MKSRLGRSVSTCALAIAWIAGPAITAAAADASVKVAFWNIRAGKGIAALPGHATPFVDSPNCTDPTQPLNAWGTGASQSVLAQAAGDPSVVALGLAESWSSVCASPENVRRTLGWQAHSGERNGVALVARHGFAAAPQWLQLDTTLNTTPGDTMWIVRAPVCLDAACTRSMPVYVAHWYGMGANGATSYARQAQQTVSYLNATAGGQPHVLVGDLNVWEGTSGMVCNQSPNNTSLSYLRNAGYMDSWLTIHGAAEGSTGMANRAGCGFPEGRAWKRIDYAWTPSSFQPTDVQRFGMTTAGDASPSDHYGVVVTLPDPSAGAPAPAPAPPAPVPAPVPTPAPAPAPLPTPDPAPASVWTSLVRAVATGTLLQKTAGCGECFDAGATGTQPIPADGSVSFTASPGHRLIVGLGSDLSASTSYSIDYAFSFWQNGTWEIRERNAYRKEGGFTATDRFTIAVEETAVKYYKNGTLVYTSGTAVAAPLVLDVSLNTIGAAVVNLTLPTTATAPPVAAPPPASTEVVWTSLVRTTATGSTLQKASGCGECFDAGAVSQQQISTAGAVSFTVSAGHRQMVGLGRDTTAATSYAIDYAFSFWTNGTWEIRESNTYRTEGAYVATDVFKVAVEGPVVKYYRNDALIYASTVPVTTPLVVDTSLHTIGATISNVRIE